MRSVIITGSEGLIGSVLCTFFEKEGVRVIPLDLSLGHDLCNEAEVKKIFKEHKSKNLINLIGLNHHIAKSSPETTNYLNCSLKSFQQFTKVNVDAPFLICREFIKNNEEGLNIVNFASLYGIRSPKAFIYPNEPKHVGYITSKHAIIGLTRYIASHFPDKVKANSVILGGVDNETINEKFRQSYCKHVPLNRMAQVSDLYEPLLFLCFKNTYMTGTEFIIDGGYNAW